MKHKIPFTQIIRHVIQLIAFLLLPGFFIMAYSAAKKVVMSLINGTFSMDTMGIWLVILIAVIPITALCGRFFCGFLCSFGAMGDLLYFVSGRILKKRPQIPEKADRILKYLKYALLIFLILGVWLPGLKLSEDYDPWYVFGRYSRLSGFQSLEALLSIGGVILLIIVVFSFFFERFFCRYLCPLGAGFALISRFRLIHIRKKEDSCVNCGLCSRNCPMGIPVAVQEMVKSGECIDCMRCTDVCASKAVCSKVICVPVKPAVIGIAAAVGIMGLYFAGNAILTHSAESSNLPISGTQTGETGKPWESGGADTGGNTESNETDKKPGDSQTITYKDGIYKGTAQGYRGSVEVEVTVKNGQITEITVISSSDDVSFFNRAKAVINNILGMQSTDVSTVSGATYSSNGIIAAVADALEIEYENPNDSMPAGGGHGGHGGHGRSGE